jgi:plasmid stabilization system protein ParE
VHPHGPHVLIYHLDSDRRPIIQRVRHASEAWLDGEQ